MVPTPRVVARIEIDGVRHEVRPGARLIDVLRGAGHDIPTLCHDDRLAPHPVCRACVVELIGNAVPVPACSTEARDGMRVLTRSPLVETYRTTTLKLLAWRHPPDILRDEAPHPFQRLIEAEGLASELRGAADPSRVDDSHPYIHVDMSRCIDCFRCVRICDDLQGQHVWKVWNRGAETVIVPDSGATLLSSSCVSCGACVTSCPTGALEDKTALQRGAATEHTRTTCPYCGVGCELDVGTRSGRITRILPVMDSPVSKGHLCVKGRYAFEFVESKDRLTTPLLRDGSSWKRASWPEALGFIADRLRAIVAAHGPDSVAVLGSARATNEENYVAQKFARVVIGTNNVDCCARVCHAPSAKALSTMFGTGAATSSYDDIEHAETILVCGANVTEGHPVVGARIKQRALHGAGLIVIDPRRIEIARVPGALHLALRPGTNVPLLHAMASVILEEGLVDEAFVAARVDGLDALRALVARYAPEAVASLTGVDPGLVRRAARLYAQRGPAIMFHGLGVTEHVQGTDGVMCLANLALLTGNLGKRGAGVNPLRGQNNVQGSAHMGCEPDALTGFARIADAAPRFEEVWGAAVPRQRGMRLPAMVDAAARRELKALWAMGYDVLLTDPNASHTRRALEQLELLVVQDLFMNETARALAHVVLPSAAAFEKDGTFMSSERRVQRVRKAVDAPGEARPDWEPLAELARMLGHERGFHFESSERIWEEIRAVWPAGRGISYARLEGGGLQWPCPSEDHPGTEILHETSFTSGPRASLASIDYEASPEQVSDDYPLLLVTGRSLYQFNAGTMTMRTPNRVLRPTDRLDITRVDAGRLGFVEGDRARVESRYGAAVLPIHLDDGLRPGELFATFADAAVFVNQLTGPWCDAKTDTPELKRTAVRLVRA